MSFDRAAHENQIDRSRRSMASHGWIEPTAYEEPPVSMLPVRKRDMVRILNDVAQDRDRPASELTSASDFAYGTNGFGFEQVPPLGRRKGSGIAESAPVDGPVPAAGPQQVGQTTQAPTAMHASAAAPSPAGNAAPADWRALGHTLEQSAAQLRLASERLGDWNLNHHLGPAIRWVEKHLDAIAATPDKTLAAWAPIITTQSAVLFEATGALGMVVSQAMKARVRPGSPEARPFHDVLEPYAVAIGEAHVSANPNGALYAARRALAKLPLELMDQALRVNSDLTREMAATVPDVPNASGIRPVETARATARTLEASGSALWDNHRAGKEMDPSALEATLTSTEEQIIIARAAVLESKVSQLADATQQATEGVAAGNANFFNDDIRKVKHALYDAMPDISAIVSTMRREAIPAGPFPADPAAGQHMFADARRRAVANAKTALVNVSEKHKLDALFKRAFASVEHAQRNTRIAQLVVDIAALIGISVISSGVATVAATAARGLVLAEAAVDTAAYARTAAIARGVGTATRLAADVSLQSGGQMLVDGHSSFGQAALTNLLTLGALRPFHAAVGTIGQLDAETRGLWKIASGGKVVLAETGKLTVETLVGAGASYVATRIAEGKSPPDALTATSWAAQGASIAVGKFIHGRMQSLNERWATFVEEKTGLAARARAQQQLAKNLEKTGNTETALYILEEHVQILQQERALLGNPAALEHLHLDPQQIRALRRGNSNALAETQGQAFAYMQLRFLGLEPLSTTGDLWSGTRTQIASLVADAGDAVHGMVPVADGEWTARMGGQDIKFVETSHWKVDPNEIKRVPQKGDNGHQYQYDAMHPGPLSDRSVYDPRNTGKPLPAQAFYGGKYDEHVLSEDTLFYRVGSVDQMWGEWFTDRPIESEAQLRIDLAVKREWSDPRTGTIPTGSARGIEKFDLWSYSILIPKGTRVYSGQTGSQGSEFMGGLGSGSKQHYIPKAWALEGATVTRKSRFKRSGNVNSTQYRSKDL